MCGSGELMKQFALRILIGVALAMIPTMALAYGGFGAGLSALGSLVAVVMALFMAIVGFIWYPIKRLLARLRRTDATRDG